MSDFSSPRSRVRWLLYLAVVCVLAGAVYYFSRRAPRVRDRGVQPAWAGTGHPTLIPVRVATAQAQELPRHLKAIGTVTPFNTVTVRSRVSGQVLRVAFEEGQRVEQGQLLAEIDPAPYQIRLAQAEGQLKQSTARLQTARADLERIRDLHTKALVSNQELEAQQALVSQYEGVQVTNQAQLDDARLQLTWTRIVAPMAGRTGMRRVDAGNLVVANDTNGLVVITQTRPISVSFTIPETAMTSVIDRFRAGQAMSVEVWDRGETKVLATGLLRTVDNQIDTATGTLRLKAEIANDDEHLFPNQFVNVRMQVGALGHAIVIPAAAVQFGSRGTYVYVVNDKQKASIRSVVLGPSDGPVQAISEGLKPGEMVVLEGLDRLREGRGVVIVNGAVAGGEGGAAAAAHTP